MLCISGLPWWLSGKESTSPLQETRVWSPVWKDPTCREATEPVHRNYWTCALEPRNRNYWAWAPGGSAPQQEKPPRREACTLQGGHTPHSPQLEGSPRSSGVPAQPKLNATIFMTHPRCSLQALLQAHSTHFDLLYIHCHSFWDIFQFPLWMLCWTVDCLKGVVSFRSTAPLQVFYNIGF